jgi:hypothetical protein
MTWEPSYNSLNALIWIMRVLPTDYRDWTAYMLFFSISGIRWIVQAPQWQVQAHVPVRIIAWRAFGCLNITSLCIVQAHVPKRKCLYYLFVHCKLQESLWPDQTLQFITCLWGDNANLDICLFDSRVDVCIILMDLICDIYIYETRIFDDVMVLNCGRDTSMRVIFFSKLFQIYLNFSIIFGVCFLFSWIFRPCFLFFWIFDFLWIFGGFILLF